MKLHFGPNLDYQHAGGADVGSLCLRHADVPLEAEVESLHAPAAAFLRPQSSSRDHQHPAERDRPH